MCLVYEARPATKDVGCFFKPAAAVRKAAENVARAQHLEPGWLNDAVKEFLNPAGQFEPFLELTRLKVLTTLPEYLLAMKCLATRLGEEFHDLADIRYLLRFLNIETSDQAKRILEKYYPPERFPQKTFYALEEMLEEQ